MKVRILVTGLVLFGLAIGSLFFYKGKGLALAKAWRFEKNIAAAEAALLKDDPNEVARRTGAAWRLGTGQLKETKALFDLASAVRSPDCYSLAEELFSHPDASFQDRLLVLQFVSAQGHTLLLDAFFGRLTEGELNNGQVTAIRIRRLLRQGNRLKALLLLDSLSSSEKELPRVQLLHCELLAQERGNPLAWQACREKAVLLMQTSSEFALPAFRILEDLSDDELVKIERPDLKKWLSKQTDVQVVDSLLVARWQLLRSLEPPKKVLQDVLNLSKEDPEAVARWLVTQRQMDVVFEKEYDLNESDTLPFYLARLQVYFNEQRWEEAARLLKTPHRAIVFSLLAGFRSTVAYRKGDSVNQQIYLQEALRRARHSENFGEYLALFELGVRLEDEELQRQSCEELVMLPSRFLPEGEKLAFLELQFGAEPEFLASLYQKLAAAKPDDDYIHYRKALLDFVVTGEGESSMRLLEELLDSYPNAHSIKSAKALIWAQESPAEALAWLEEERGREHRFDSALETAVYARLLRANGKASQAQHLENRVEWSALPVFLRDYFEQKQISVKL